MPASVGLDGGVDDLALSRVRASIERLGSDAEHRHSFHDRPVLVTGDPMTLATVNGRLMMLAGLRLLARVSRSVTVMIPGGLAKLEFECRQEAKRVAGPGTISFTSAADDSSFEAVLEVGGRQHSGVLGTTIYADGWQVYVDSSGARVPVGPSVANPVTALAAAALGVAEVFKRLSGVRSSRGPLFEQLSWSLFTYQTGPGDRGPPLPDSVPLDAVILGCGAIGNGLLAALHDLPLSGRIVVLDRQGFGPENLGTCLLLGLGDVSRAKAEVAAEWLTGAHPTLDVRAIVGSVESYAAGIEQGREPAPAIVATALDNPEARRIAQGIWPSQVVDGAIGDFMCQVGVHPWGQDIACLRCLYHEPVGERAEVVAARVTGLTPERALQADDVVRETDVAHASPEFRDFLHGHLDHSICSVVSEAVIAAISDGTSQPRFAPSVPFVACLTAAMMAAELVKASAGWATPLAPRFQFDALLGPACGLDLPVVRRSDCACVTRAGLIERVQAARLALRQIT